MTFRHVALTAPASLSGDVRFAAADLNQNGDTVLAYFTRAGSGWFDNEGEGPLSRYENADGRGAFGSVRPIQEFDMSERRTKFGDLDGDGDIDLVSGGGASKVVFDQRPIGSVWPPRWRYSKRADTKMT